jgi:hypothetical protein
MSGRVEGVGGNREVSRLWISGGRGDLSGASAGASPEEGSEPKASEVRA